MHASIGPEASLHGPVEVTRLVVQLLSIFAASYLRDDGPKGGRGALLVIVGNLLRSGSGASTNKDPLIKPLRKPNRRLRSVYKPR